MINIIIICTGCGLLTVFPKGLMLAVGGSTAGFSGPVLVDGFTYIRKKQILYYSTNLNYNIYFKNICLKLKCILPTTY